MNNTTTPAPLTCKECGDPITSPDRLAMYARPRNAWMVEQGETYCTAGCFDVQNGDGR